MKTPLYYMIARWIHTHWLNAICASRPLHKSCISSLRHACTKCTMCRGVVVDGQLHWWRHNFFSIIRLRACAALVSMLTSGAHTHTQIILIVVAVRRHAQHNRPECTYSCNASMRIRYLNPQHWDYYIRGPIKYNLTHKAKCLLCVLHGQQI